MGMSPEYFAWRPELYGPRPLILSSRSRYSLFAAVSDAM